MHNARSFIFRLPSRFTLVAVAALLALSAATALAKKNTGSDGGETLRNFLLTAPGGWGEAQDQAVAAAGGTVIYRHAAAGVGTAESYNPDFVRALMRSGAFGNSGEDMMVQWVEPGSPVQADDDLTEEAVTPGDETFANLQWSMTAIEAAGAWAAGYDGAGVRVAVIDGGICKDHIDLKDNIDNVASRSFVPGFNYYEDTGGPTAFRHACHVSGIIAAEDNAVGTVGVAPKATIISLKALHGGSGSFGAVIQAILYASDAISEGGAGADIINMSLGALFPRGGGNTGAGPLVAAMNQAVNYATSKNVLVVSSSGNAGQDLDHLGSYIQVPAQSGSGLGIGATGPLGYAVGWPAGATNFRHFAYYSNYGHSVNSLAAPGGEDSYTPTSSICSIPRVPAGSVIAPCWVFDLILSPGAGTTSYFFADGTSMAAPHVAGVAALVKQKYPGISVGDLKTHLLQTADDEGDVGADPLYGQGFLNARRALTEPLGSEAWSATPSAVAAATGLVVLGDPSRGGKFAFALPKSGDAKLELFDVAGRKVAVIFNGNASAGQTLVSWDGRDASGQLVKHGAYFARVTSGDLKAARKLVLLGQ